MQIKFVIKDVKSEPGPDWHIQLYHDPFSTLYFSIPSILLAKSHILRVFQKSPLL